MNNSRPKIQSLQALRALAFISIFMLHAHFYITKPLFGVSIFIIMSGFLMMYRYCDKDIPVSIKDNFTFAINRIKSIYPLHIITMIFAIFLFFLVIHKNGYPLYLFIELIQNIFLNVTLTQTWIPDPGVNTSLNGVAWYLSLILFMYFLFPYFRSYINKNNTKKMIAIILIGMILQVLACIFMIKIFGSSSAIYNWFNYYFPVFRILDFFSGCVLGKIYLKTDFDEISYFKASVLEIVTLILVILLNLYLNSSQENIFLIALQNKSTLLLPLSSMGVILFVLNKGVLTRLFSNKYLIYLGDLSSYAFLIHTMVIWYVIRFLELLGYNPQGIYYALMVLIQFVLTIIISELYKRVHEKKN